MNNGNVRESHACTDQTDGRNRYSYLISLEKSKDQDVKVFVKYSLSWY